MSYRNLRTCVNDLSQKGMLIRIEQEVDPYLEAAEIQRRVYTARGPAIYFSRLKGCRFPALSNLFGTKERVDYIFRKTLRWVKQLVKYKIDPHSPLKEPVTALRTIPAAWSMLPRRVSHGLVLSQSCELSELPQIVSWPQDGGAFITLPQVYTESPLSPGLMKSNLGMYRIQISGNEYQKNKETGLHYQIHRSIGVHHKEALARGESLKCNVFIGGSPAMSLAAVMPLPEGMSELMFAGALSGHRIPMINSQGGIGIYADADFCICGEIETGRLLPEGPFGDHLGYYSLKHDFPVLKVNKVYHRPDPIWHFTSVGRPPQEDTAFGEIIHEITGPAIPALLPGVKAVHAVDAAGVHPLLLAIGSERYVPYAQERMPLELLTQARAILGQGQLSLAKYLFIICEKDNPELDINDIPRFFQHLLERIDFRRDLHFETCTTIDTLDYSGTGFNQGSKVTFAAAGKSHRILPQELDTFNFLPEGFHDVQLCLPGVIAVQADSWSNAEKNQHSIDTLIQLIPSTHPMMKYPLWIIVDDAKFTSRSLNNFLWVTFTRSDPASDIYGVGNFIKNKHWGACGPLVIDARIKSHHAPPLVEEPEVTRRVDQLASPGGPLHGII